MTAREFVDSVDTPGGHIIIAVSIGIAGVLVATVAVWTGHDKIAEIVAPMIGFFGIAAYAMRGTDKANSQIQISTEKRTESPIDKPLDGTANDSPAS